MAKITYKKPRGGETQELEKRFYAYGYTITDKCPKCKKLNKIDLGDNYLCSPTVGMPEDVHFYCDHCECDWQVQVVVSIKIELV